LTVGKKRFYPIMVAEKQVCWMKATVRGRGGHGSIPVRDGAMAKLSRLLQQLDQRDLPVHITPPARLMFDAMSAELSGAQKLILGQLTNPMLANSVAPLPSETSPSPLSALL
jgi:acetylornithine deacetylase/succinyl-diaminopimelate desuccinylase-like protein